MTLVDFLHDKLTRDKDILKDKVRCTCCGSVKAWKYRWESSWRGKLGVHCTGDKDQRHPSEISIKEEPKAVEKIKKIKDPRTSYLPPGARANEPMLGQAKNDELGEVPLMSKRDFLNWINEQDVRDRE